MLVANLEHQRNAILKLLFFTYLMHFSVTDI